MLEKPGNKAYDNGSGSSSRLLPPWWFKIVICLGAAYIRLVCRTTRWQIEKPDQLEALISQECGFISSVWHGRLFLSPTWALPSRHNVAMISRSRDGEIISAIVSAFGISAVRGSTNDIDKGVDKGGTGAYSAAKMALRDQAAVVLMTPDGPRGPRMRAKAGIAVLSISTGAPVVPISYSTRWGFSLSNWDQFLVPLPFGRGAIAYGTPLYPPARKRSKLSDFRKVIEEETTKVMKRADELVGRRSCSPVQDYDRPKGGLSKVIP